MKEQNALMLSFILSVTLDHCILFFHTSRCCFSGMLKFREGDVSWQCTKSCESIYSSFCPRMLRITCQVHWSSARRWRRTSGQPFSQESDGSSFSVEAPCRWHGAHRITFLSCVRMDAVRSCIIVEEQQVCEGRREDVS